MSPLHHAAAFGDEEVTLALLNHSANVHHVDAEGRTPLHYAAVEVGRVIRAVG